MFCNATDPDADKKLVQHYVNQDPIEVKCKYQPHLQRQPYLTHKDSPIKTTEYNQERFSGVAFPCNYNTTKEHTLLIILFNKHHIIPTIKMFGIDDTVKTYTWPNTIANQSTARLPTTNEKDVIKYSILCVSIIIGLVVIVILIFFLKSKLKKKPPKNNGARLKSNDFERSSDTLTKKNGESYHLNLFGIICSGENFVL